MIPPRVPVPVGNAERRIPIRLLLPPSTKSIASFPSRFRVFLSTILIASHGSTWVLVGASMFSRRRSLWSRSFNIMNANELVLLVPAVRAMKKRNSKIKFENFVKASPCSSMMLFLFVYYIARRGPNTSLCNKTKAWDWNGHTKSMEVHFCFGCSNDCQQYCVRNLTRKWTSWARLSRTWLYCCKKIARLASRTPTVSLGNANSFPGREIALTERTIMKIRSGTFSFVTKHLKKNRCHYICRDDRIDSLVTKDCLIFPTFDQFPFWKKLNIIFSNSKWKVPFCIAFCWEGISTKSPLRNSQNITTYEYKLCMDWDDPLSELLVECRKLLLSSAF